ncbi:MAG: acyl-CoA thioesterase [Candidatus Omnitrophica bacterium]|nr:acyl-CoA thioesterase [Candidatus Omnitrophota bacterium]
MQKKIYYHHTDCGGVVYYGKYLEFLEEARTEFLAERGVLIKELAEQGILFVVVRQEIDYKMPAFYADILRIETQITNISKVSMEFSCLLKNQNDKIISQAKTILACVDKNLKPKPIPTEIRSKIS